MTHIPAVAGKAFLWPLLWLLCACAAHGPGADAARTETAGRPDTGPGGEALYRATLEVRSPGDPFLAQRFSEVSRLALMRDQPADLATLDQRLAVSLTEAESLLRNQGYYEGRASGRLENPSGDQVPVVVAFDPGPRYKFGRVLLNVFSPGDDEPPSESPDPAPRPLNPHPGAEPPPLALDLAPGAPARADDMLEAVDRLLTAWRNRGFPEARVQSSRYFINRDLRELEAEITLAPGPFVRLGPVLARENAPVDPSYLDSLKTWQDGQPWNQARVDEYLATLRRTGLFQTVEMTPGPARPTMEEGQTDEGETRPVRLALTPAAPRTVGGQINYDTNFGPGVKAYWEHRNLIGHGDRLRLDLPLWADLQEFTAAYRYPFIFRPDQDFIAKGGVLHQDTEAYRLVSGSLSAGVERRLSDRWRASLSGYLEGGSLEDPGQDAHRYQVAGLPAGLSYDRTNDLLDPTRGARLNLSAAPYTGSYHENFQVFRSRLEGQAFLPLGTPRAVLALRGLWGGAWGVDHSQDVPSSLRFYSGGGGSVRGYDYQSLGPRNEKDEPLGGLSQVETGAEARARFNEDLGAVAFLDGGTVYSEAADRLFQDLRWGAGAGLRYFTPVGPVRLDVAVPLDRRPDDSPWQLYLSLGQSF
jgi:translocation and assembly module TamA